MIATVVLAVILGSVRGRPEPPEPSHTLSVWPDPASGDSTAFAVSPPRDPVSQQEWADVLGRLQEAAADPAADATDKRRLAIALYNLGRLDETEAIYRSLLETGEDAVVRNRLGNVLRDRGDLAGAEEAYREAIATDPSLPAPYINLAEMLWQLHRDDEAFALLDAADDAVSEAALPAIERTREALAGTSATTTT